MLVRERIPKVWRRKSDVAKKDEHLPSVHRGVFPMVTTWCGNLDLMVVLTVVYARSMVAKR